MRTTKKPQYFVRPESKDITFLQRVATESSDLFNREIGVRFLDRARTTVDALYGESKNEVYADYFVRANVEMTPKKAVLTKMGIDEPRDLLIHINNGILLRGSGPQAEEGDEDPFCTERGGYPAPEPGDMFIVEGDLFKVLDHEHVDYEWHTEEFATHAYACERYRERSVDDATPVDPAANPDGPKKFPTHTTTDFPGEGS